LARSHRSGVVVIGLGRFGESLARELMEGGETDVLAIDLDRKLVQKLSGVLTHTVVADSTDEEAMRQLGVHEFRRVVIAIGRDLEASILTTSVILSLGVPDVWAKAISEPHARILERLGVMHVVRPEHDTGRRVAHLVKGRLIDYIEFDDGYAIVKARPPRSILGRPLKEVGVRTTWGVTIVGRKQQGQDFTHATENTVIEDGDLIIVSGNRLKVEAFANSQ